MTEEVKAAVFGNVGSMITFRVGAYDAETLEKEFAPTFTMEDIVNLDKFQVYLRLMIDGVGSQPFSANTLNTPPTPDINFVSEIIDTSRSQFARPRASVEDEIKDWHRPIEEVEKDKRNAGKEGGNRGGFENGSGRNNSGNNNHTNSYSNSSGKNGDFKLRNPAPSLQQNSSLSYEKRNEGRMGFKERQNIFHKKEDGIHNPFKKALAHGTSEEREKAHLERELELRKAISLNFLKKEEPKDNGNDNREEKKDKKGVTQESLSDLRSALQSVLTQANIGIGPETKTLEKTQGGEVRLPEKQGAIRENIVESRSSEKQTNHNNTNSVTSGSNDVLADVRPPLKKSSDIREITEKELRDILSIED
jgi:hypothetical protein